MSKKKPKGFFARVRDFKGTPIILTVLGFLFLVRPPGELRALIICIIRLISGTIPYGVIQPLYFRDVFLFISTLFFILAIVLGIRRRGVLGYIGITLSCFGIGFMLLFSLAVDYTLRAPTSEATLSLDRIAENILTKLNGETKGADRRSPDRGADYTIPEWTPAVPCCDQACWGRCDPEENSKFFETPKWNAIDFHPSDNFMYQYRIVKTDLGITVQARGDLDCDGEYSLYERALIRGTDGTWKGGQAIYNLNPLE